MSINRLNLEIGGPGPEERDRKKLIREMQDVGIRIDSLIEDIQVVEEQEEQVITEEVVAPTRQKTRQEMMAESISLYHTKTNQTLQEVPLASDGERIKLLEDAFAQMKRGQPQTLVVGAGASLDSGGGAVWLWDLEDVSIGAPMNGVYPYIEDGSVLKYDSQYETWRPGAPGSGGGSADNVITTFLEFDGTQTTQGIRASGATGKKFAINVGDDTSSATTVARFEPGKVTLPSGQLASADINSTTGTIGTLNANTIEGVRAGVLWKLSAGDGLQFKDQASSHIGGTPGETGGNAYNVGYGTLELGPTVIRTTGDQIILGNKTYTGSTAEDDALQTKSSVMDIIAANAGGGFVFMGTTDITGPAPANPGPADFYINTVTGVADDSWTGLGGSTINQDQLIIYSDPEARWFAGAVEDNSTYLSKTGGTMTGNITMDGTSVINFSNSQSFPPSLTAAYLQKSGGTMSGTLVTDEVEVPLGKTITIKRGNSNTSIGGLDIKGYQPGQFTVETDIFAVSYGNGTSTGDSINYKGRTDGAGNIQTKSSVQALINANPATGFVPLSGGVMTGDLQIDISSTNPSNIALEIEEDGATNFRVLRSGTVSSKVLTCTGINVNGPSALDGTLDVTGTATLNDGLTVKEGLLVNQGLTVDCNSNNGIVLNNSSSTNNKNGAIRFADGNSTAATGQDTYVLIQGRGNTTAGNLIFARDTTNANVVDEDIYFKLQAPRSGTGPHDVETIFVQPVQGPTPIQDADLTTKEYVDGGDWVTVNVSSSDIKSTSSIQYRIAGKTVHWRINAKGQSVLTNGNVYCSVPNEARPPINTVFQLMPEFSGSNANGTFVNVYINATSGTMMQLSNDKPVGSASETATINNTFFSSQGPPSASGVISYPID